LSTLDLIELIRPSASASHRFYLQMTAQNSLDHKGNFTTYPLAELLTEIGQARLDGSMRLSHGDGKAILYFRDGALVYGVSNAREHRLLQVLLDLKKVEPAKLTALPKCSNDVELSMTLARENVLAQEEIEAVIVAQIERILVDSLSRPAGEWHFSPLVRSREDLIFPVDVHKVLTDYARVQPLSAVFGRFKSMQERFEKIADSNGSVNLQSHEEYVLERFGPEPRSIEELTLECGLPENGFLQALYVLWLGGMLRRHDWNAAFSENRIRAIRNARVMMVKQAQKTAAEAKPDAKPAEVQPEAEPAPEATEPKVPEITLIEYLKRVESSRTHYDVLGLDSDAALAAIKTSYFSLAKLFHPDRFHRESAEMLPRIHAAFSKVQVAYDTLKSSDSRENYNYKVRKDLEMKEKLKAQGVDTSEKIDAKAEQGLESFEVGLSLLMDEEYERAVPFLGRAAHYNPDNALYRAYFGKALSYDSEQRHKAEGEMQAAAKLDPTNPKIRLMLVEFFMDHNMMKRAEGELRRFLDIVPNNAEAKGLLARIQN
ncbi:MAG: DnaJ domain-containing protein, partial [Pyrinomonadaceae bacterium]